jgi:hypothetical protein
MKIAVFYPASRHAAWSAGEAIPGTLRRMGHEVVAGAMPVELTSPNPQQFENIKADLPSLEMLQRQDVVLVSGLEHVAPWLEAVYGAYEWKQLKARRAAWYHESFFREDFTIDFEALGSWVDEHFFPGIQDAEFFDQESFALGRSHWLPLGVDTTIFRQERGLTIQKLDESLREITFAKTSKKWPIAFIGMMYEKRGRFLQALSRHDFPRVRIGTVGIEDLAGWDAEGSARRLADNYRRVGVFFNLPALSQLLVSKIYEVMACGTFCLTPMLSADRGINKNMEPFESGRHLVFYRSSNLPFVAQLLREWSSPEKEAEREKIAAEGCREVHERHSLEKRLEVILAKCGVKEVVQ